MHDLVEKVTQREKDWLKIKEDTAFESVLDGFDMSVYTPHLRKMELVVQAGGYCGVFPRYFSESFNMVYTFEPDPLNFFCLNINCQKPNVIKAQGALGNKHECVRIVHRSATNRGMNIVEPNLYGVPTYMIDDLSLPTCDFICLDVEGYEFNILKGAYNTITKYKPLISVEDTNPEIESILLPIGYKKCGTIHRDTLYYVPWKINY